ncbi:MAG: hypothetical protein ACE5GB_03035 [Acidimicrobiales bacterium]
MSTDDSPVDDTRPTALFGGSNLDQLMPVALFIGLYNFVGTEAAVVGSTAWSVKAGYARRRRGLPIGGWLPAITAYLVLRALITIAVERELVDFGVSAEAVYFGIGFGTKILVGLVIAGTVLAGRPLLAWLIPKLIELDPSILGDPRYRTAMTNVTWMIAAYELLSSVWDIWLFNHSGVSLFLVTRQVVNFVVAFAAITVGLMYIDRKLQPIEAYPGLVELLEESGPLRR